MSVDLDARFAAGMSGWKGHRLGIAVSGGGDSMALLHLTRAWAASRDVGIYVATVDHGLRAASAAEAEQVATWCQALHVPHDTLRWLHDGVTGNLQDAARKSRRRLLREWGAQKKVDAILLGHTKDDQAETVLMRLARGSGVDGLAGMDQANGLWRRPLLGIYRADLRAYLDRAGASWLEDPSNDDLQFDRIKARQMAAALSDLGLTADRLTQTAAHMRAARASLWSAAQGFAERHVQQDRGDLILTGDWSDFDGHDVPRRVFAAAFQWFSGDTYKPRFASLQTTFSKLITGEKVTLGGVLATPHAGDTIRLTREVAACEAAIIVGAMAGDAEQLIWDRRWVVKRADGGALPTGVSVQALSDDIKHCPNWRQTGLPRASLMASPAIWCKNRLIAAPLAGYGDEWQARTVADFHDGLLAH